MCDDTHLDPTGFSSSRGSQVTQKRSDARRVKGTRRKVQGARKPRQRRFFETSTPKPCTLNRVAYPCRNDEGCGLRASPWTTPPFDVAQDAGRVERAVESSLGFFRSLLNEAADSCPIEAHLPGMTFDCPGLVGGVPFDLQGACVGFNAGLADSAFKVPFFRSQGSDIGTADLTESLLFDTRRFF